MLAMGLLDWRAQWRALRAVTVLKVVRDRDSKVGEIARGRLDGMRERRRWLVSPLWAQNTRWNGNEKRGVMGTWLEEAGGVGIHPLHDFQVGDLASTWSMKNKVGYEGVVMKIQKKDKYNEQDMVKVQDSGGNGEWWPRHWLVRAGNEREWAGQGVASAKGEGLRLEKGKEEEVQGGTARVGAVKALRQGMREGRPMLTREMEINKVRKDKVLNTKLLSFLYRYKWGGLWLMYRERQDKLCLCCGEAGETKRHKFKECT